MEIALDLPVFASAYAYSRARSASFTMEYLLLQSLYYLLPDNPLRKRPRLEWETLQEIRQDLTELLREDCAHIAAGDYPLSVLLPESPIQHLRRIPKLLADSFSIYRRRVRGRTAEFDARARELLADLPRYYRRNFHFQTSGYLSRRSAEVYEHQVELLFQGCADAMRRLIVTSLRERFGKTQGEGLRFLEIGAGTGRATRFVHLAFPKATIIAVDLSDPYLKVAQQRLSKFSRIGFLQADGASLPFRSGEFDAAFSVFLFHELPRDARRQVLAESRRVLKAGGFIGFVDSLQTGDKALFDPLLKQFPKDFHEPFYRDYISHPMEELLEEKGFSEIKTGTGFSSKVVSAVR